MAEPYYQDDWCVIYHGDCLDVMTSLDPVDTVVTDPPYFLPATHYNVRSGSFRSLSDLSMLEHFFRSFFQQAAQTLKPTGFLYAFCDGQSYPAFYATAFLWFKRLRPLVWDKQVSINGYGWRHQHELILFAEKDEAPKVPTGDGDVIRGRAVPIDSRFHLAEKPVDVLSLLIAKTTPADGVVLDPFVGSGSTLVAARTLGFRAIGIERDERYCEIAAQRLQGVSPVDRSAQEVLDFGEAG